VGEVYNGDVGYVSGIVVLFISITANIGIGYQSPNGPLPGVLSYPLFFTLRGVFASVCRTVFRASTLQNNQMWDLQSINEAYSSSMPDVSLLGLPSLLLFFM
jgi:hypothetical protein